MVLLGPNTCKLQAMVCLILYFLLLKTAAVLNFCLVRLKRVDIFGLERSGFGFRQLEILDCIF